MPRTGHAHAVLDDLRPMLWQATIIAPAADAGVTVVLRVTYRTIEALCAAEDDPVELALT